MKFFYASPAGTTFAIVAPTRLDATRRVARLVRGATYLGPANPAYTAALLGLRYLNARDFKTARAVAHRCLGQ